MALSLATPENQRLFHRVRQGSMFPQVILSTQGASGLRTGWARCCGFNLSQQRLFCLPLHSHFALERESQTASLVMACPEARLSLHFSGLIATLHDPNLASHFWRRLEPIVNSLSLSVDQLWAFQVTEMAADRFDIGLDATLETA